MTEKKDERQWKFETGIMVGVFLSLVVTLIALLVHTCS